MPSFMNPREGSIAIPMQVPRALASTVCALVMGYTIVMPALRDLRQQWHVRVRNLQRSSNLATVPIDPKQGRTKVDGRDGISNVEKEPLLRVDQEELESAQNSR